MINEVYQQIITSAPSIFNYVSIYNKQIKRLLNGSNFSYNNPSLFIEIQEEQQSIETLGNQLTASNLIIIFHIVMMELDGAVGNMDQNLNIFNLRNEVKKNYSLFKLTQGGTFNWMNEDEDYDHGSIYHYLIKYKAYYIDFSSYNILSPFNSNIIPAIWGLENQLWGLENQLWASIFLEEPALNIQINNN